MHDELVIEPSSGFKHYWRDLWRYRELFYIPRLARCGGALQADCDRHRLGADPAVCHDDRFRRLSLDKVAKLEAPGSVPYPLLVFAAMLPWQFFATAL